ncbi:PRP3-domain-containing protein [Zopfia rhizophila CBS 207.26]|uniref:PRP3-domain-containing protein n=1 Tax=Zopfia rhizophila CBS 207.26 TaxID=1314779 RepID=A0A6A6EWC2_9PEZI|nr:PRP3-domain-containing protein [Zopfia rhizophila CBS 207.26]
MVEKRPHSGENGLENGNKRPKSNTPAPNGAADLLAQAKARAAAINARLTAGKAAASAGPASPANKGSPSPASPQQPPVPDDPQARLAAVRARMAALKAGKSLSGSTDAPPVRPPPSHGPPIPPPPPEFEQDGPRPKGGLSIGLHPALMGGDSRDEGRSKGKGSMAPRFATTLANRRTESPVPEKKQLDLSGPNMEELKQNPYFDPNIKSGAPKNRVSRSLVFNQKGKYLEQGAKLRQQAKLEEIKAHIARQARQAGLDENNERGFIIQPPPDVEWWDEGMLEDKTYHCIANPAKVKITTKDSIITAYVQHPVLLKPPQEQRLVQIKPMYLTQKEQAKLRRMRRAADLKEHQAKIRLGLEPPPPPKVKRGNMMRVMGEQAIADPTAVEMLVETQIRERADAHDKANEERKLTKEQRHAKLAEQQQKDAQKGLYMCVFKIDSLAFGKHRYQIDNNAKQHVLTGIAIFHPKLNLVVVEGGMHSISKYKKLMLHRIKWTENAMPGSVREGNQEVEAQWLNGVDEQGNLKDLSLNKCQLIFEGEVRQRAFRKWGSKVCETDGEAKDTLARSKLDSLWALAKSTE